MSSFELAPPAAVTNEEQDSFLEAAPVETAKADDQEESPQSYLENIVPLNKLRNGLSFFGQWAMATAATVQSKAAEINNSEKMGEYKRQLSESTVAAWNKTCEVSKQASDAAQPYLTHAAAATQTAIEKVGETAAKVAEQAGPVMEETKKHIFVAVEKTKEATISASEKMKPALDSVSAATADVYNSMMHVSGGVTSGGDGGSSGLGSPSALDNSVKGNLTTL